MPRPLDADSGYTATYLICIGHDQAPRRGHRQSARATGSDQEVAANFLLGFADPDANRYQLTDEQVAEIELAKQEVRAGKIVSEAEMAKVWRRFGL